MFVPIRRAAAAFCLFIAIATQLLAAPTIRVQLSDKASTQPYSGRVYVFFSQGRPEPRGDHSFGRHEPIIARDVENLRPGESVVFSEAEAAHMLSYPSPYAELNLANFRAQAVMRLNPFVPGIGRGAGNGYSAATAVPDAKEAAMTLVVDQLVPTPEFRESEFCKLLSVKSEHLSKFHGRDVYVNAGVILPPSYFKELERRYPVVFSIPGFGGTHLGARGGPTQDNNDKGVEFIRLALDGSCQRGHHVFADSANNGPWATALVEDFIPELNKQFRTVPDAGSRFLTGTSSGGWSSLWLQVTRPDDFGGTWSHSPDPVDFRDFQQINLYEPNANLYVDATGKPRPLSRGRGGGPGLLFKDFSQAETILGYGGQLHSFEAAFSPRDANGEPLYLWNRKTGAIDAAVAKEWEKYDIRLVLERNWKTLGPKLAGKLHIHMGDQDTYYLEGATFLLRDKLKELGSDAEVVIYPGEGHGTFVGRIRNQLSQQMADAFAKNHPEAIPMAVAR